MFDNFFQGPMLMLITSSVFLINAFCPKRQKLEKVDLILRLLWGIAVIAAVCVLDTVFVNPDNASTSLQPPLCFLAIWLYAKFVLKMSPDKAVYCCVWSFLMAEVLAQGMAKVLFLFRIPNRTLNELVKILLMLLMSGGVGALVSAFFAKLIQHDGDYLITRRKALFSLLLILLHMVLTNYQVIFWLIGNSDKESGNMVVVFRIVIGLFAMVILYLQNDIEKRQQTQQELEIVRQMWHQQQEQYKLSKENIEIINRKCHDLKHQMAALRTMKDQQQIDRQVAEMESAVMIYDSAIRTGNTVLDVVLTEKCLYCEAHRINMTCLVDGKLLEFVEAVDLYTLFGNALDNAIESVMQQKDKQKRVIQVAAYEEQGMLLIRVRNYCDKAPVLVDGLPVTTKEDTQYHGFGIKSIRYTAEKYGGGISIQTGNNFFSLQILLPIPGKQA